MTFALSLEKGFDNVSMKQIQEATGLATGSLYYHFKNKDEILLYMVDKYIMKGFNQLKKDMENFDGSFIEKIRHIFKFKHTNLAKDEDESYYISTRPDFDYRDYFILTKSVYHNHPEIRDSFTELHDKLYDFYYELIKEAIKNQEIRDDIDIRTLVIFIQTTLKGYIDLYIYQPHIELEENVDANVKMVWEAIKKR